MEQVDTVVIGAGVVGLACARAFALAGREVIVLESENTIGTGSSSRNSEVIHAGIYYPPGSLKAKLCVAGRLAQERLDGRALLVSFVDNYGKVEENKGIAGQITTFLSKARKVEPCPPANSTPQLSRTDNQLAKPR